MQVNGTYASRSDAIAGRLRRLLNEGMLALLAGMGSRAGWFDALASVQPASAEVVARAAGAEEGRVGAWLAALVAGRLVEYDGARGTYALPSELTTFLSDARGRAYQDGLASLAVLAATAPRAHAAGRGTPSASELLALVPGLRERLQQGMRAVVLGAGSLVLGRALDEAFPASRFEVRERGGLPRGERGRLGLALALDLRVQASATMACRLAAALASGGVAIFAAAATSESPADDALHPMGAFLQGVRAFKPAAAPTEAGTAMLGAHLAAAGLDVGGLARVPSDPFRNYLIAHKPDSRNA